MKSGALRLSYPALLVNDISGSLALTPHGLRILRDRDKRLMLMSGGN
jgi:hypothetical protein